MWPIPEETAYFVKLTKEILNGKLHFLCSDERMRGIKNGWGCLTVGESAIW